MPTPGQQTGQRAGQPPEPPSAAEAGYGWGDLVDDLVDRRGTLAAVALHLAEQRGFTEDVESAERGLRRLRRRGTAEGGVWGERVMRCFGLPTAVADRIRWMGQYHTRFIDLPASLAEELVQPWDRPPVSAGPTRIWLLLARINLAFRRRVDAEPLLSQAALLEPRAEPAARIELALVESFAWSRRDLPASTAALDRAEALLTDPGADAGLTDHDRACLFARYIDQRAYGFNRPRSGPPDHAAARALYARIPPDGPLFARCRRENGMGWSVLKLGDRAAAAAHARASVEAAGDAGSLRMRAMALNLLAAASEGQAAAAAKHRAQAIAARLEDEALALRFDRRRPRPA